MLTPKEIFKKYCQKEIDKPSSVEFLLSIIEYSADNQIRVECLDTLNKIGVNNEVVYKTIENLMISDSNPEVRISALYFLFTNYQEKVLTPIKWMLNYETTFKCQIAIIKILGEIDNDQSKNLLRAELKKIRYIKYLNPERNYKNKKYQKLIKKLLKSNEIEKFSIEQISEMIINFLIIRCLSEIFPNVFFELNPQNLLVEELDLSDYLEYEVKGTPWGWKNNISSISEIEGLNSLKNLKRLDLSNNQIQDIKELHNLKSLTHLVLANNKIREQNNLVVLNGLPNLIYLDICGNEVVKNLNKSIMNPNLQIISKRYLETRFEE